MYGTVLKNSGVSANKFEFTSEIPLQCSLGKRNCSLLKELQQTKITTHRAQALRKWEMYFPRAYPTRENELVNRGINARKTRTWLFYSERLSYNRAYIHSKIVNTLKYKAIELGEHRENIITVHAKFKNTLTT